MNTALLIMLCVSRDRERRNAATRSHLLKSDETSRVHDRLTVFCVTCGFVQCPFVAGTWAGVIDELPFANVVEEDGWGVAFCELLRDLESVKNGLKMARSSSSR